VNTALLVLRLVPGMLLIGHGLQKLGPAKCSPRLLHAVGHKAIATASSNSIFGEGSRLRCSLGRLRSLGPLARRGTFTPVGTILIGADMTTAILTVRARHGIGARGRLRVPARPDGRRLRHYGVGRRLLLDQRMGTREQLGRDPQLANERRRARRDFARGRRRRRTLDGDRVSARRQESGRHQHAHHRLNSAKAAAGRGEIDGPAAFNPLQENCVARGDSAK
jgi:hypothetical protein